jgi:predicted glycosyltransferase
MEDRIRRLVAAITEAPPDVVTIEHYPWSKWELEAEVLAAIGMARRSNPAVRVVCSLRDIAPRTRYEAVPEREYERRVLERLAAHFDAVLVHADPRFTRLEEHFGRVPDLRVPWAYTGFVTTAGSVPEPTSVVWPEPYAVLSAGSGADELPFLLAAGEAFGRMAARSDLGAMRLVVFAGPSLAERDLDALRQGSAIVLPFSPEFPAWLRRSALSVSRAGYNTCADLLNARVPAVLVPHPRMSDQSLRAERMRAHGLASVVRGDPPGVDAFIEAIRTARVEQPASHDFALCGVAATRTLLEGLHRKGTMSGTGEGDSLS